VADSCRAPDNNGTVVWVVRDGTAAESQVL